jgi:hypothetical protein
MYLDHHWAIDAIAGWGVAIFATLVAGKLVDVLYGDVREVALDTGPVSLTVQDG